MGAACIVFSTYLTWSRSTNRLLQRALSFTVPVFHLEYPPKVKLVIPRARVSGKLRYNNGRFRNGRKHSIEKSQFESPSHKPTEATIIKRLDLSILDILSTGLGEYLGKILSLDVYGDYLERVGHFGSRSFNPRRGKALVVATRASTRKPTTAPSLSRLGLHRTGAAVLKGYLFLFDCVQQAVAAAVNEVNYQADGQPDEKAEPVFAA